MVSELTVGNDPLYVGHEYDEVEEEEDGDGREEDRLQATDDGRGGEGSGGQLEVVHVHSKLGTCVLTVGMRRRLLTPWTARLRKRRHKAEEGAVS
jgi:hypothetical protein